MALWRFFCDDVQHVSCRSRAPACLMINLHDWYPVNAEGERHRSFIAISELSISSACLCYALWSWISNGHAKKKFPGHCKAWDAKEHGAEMLTQQVSVARKKWGKTPVLFPIKDFCAARKKKNSTVSEL